MDDRIVPCGNNLSRFLLGLIPGRRDVYLRALEDRESCHVAGKILPQWVGSGDQAPQGSQRLRPRLELHGNVVRIETRSIESHKSCQRMFSHQIMQDLKTRLFKMCGNVHTSPRGYDFSADPRIGMVRTRTAQASKTALATAGGTAIIGVSPAPTEGKSRRLSRTVSMGGTSLKRGTEYSE